MSSVFEKENKVVLIVGCESKLGKDMIARFAKDKTNLVVGFIHRNKYYKVYDNFFKHSSKLSNVFIFGVDYDEYASIDKRVSQIIEKFKKIDILINNTGMYEKNITDNSFNAEAQDNTMQANFYTPFYVCRSVLPHMLVRKIGKIINVNSMNALSSQPMDLFFPPKKNIMRCLTNILQRELMYTGISIKDMAPSDVGYSETKQAKQMQGFFKEFSFYKAFKLRQQKEYI